MVAKKEQKSEKTYEVWDVFEKFGKFQKLQYFYVCYATVFVSMANINYIFVAGDVNYRYVFISIITTFFKFSLVSQCELYYKLFHSFVK